MKKEINTELIEKFMKERMMTKTQFCKTTKISISTFEKLMNENYDFYIDALFKIAKAMQVQIKDLFIR